MIGRPYARSAARWLVHWCWAAQLSDSSTTPLAYAPSPAKQHTTWSALLVAVGHRRAGRDRDAAADDRVGAQVAGREVADVHAAASPPAVALLLAE